MQLHLQTWPEVEAYLQTSHGIILPIGSTEQHGPVGVIGTDAICAEVIASGVGEAAPALVGPTIGVGMAQHHIGFSRLDHPAAEHLDRGAARHGRIPGRTRLRAAFTSSTGMAGTSPPLPPPFPRSTRPAACRRRGASRRSSAGSETGGRAKASGSWPKNFMAMPKAATRRRARSRSPSSPIPRRSSRRPLDPVIAPRGDFSDAADYRRNFPDGRIGSNSALATPEAGKRLYDAAVAALTKDYLSWVGA